MTVEKKSTVLIADDHIIFRDGLRRLLETEPHIEVVGEASNGAEATTMALNLMPDLVLLDMAMPGATGMHALSELKAAGYTKPILVLTAELDPTRYAEALRLGARGIVRKESATRMLLDAIDAVFAGAFWVGDERVDDLQTHLTKLEEAALAPARRFNLTRREREIIPAVVRGLSNRDIAKEFNLSEDTVKHHLTNIYNKTGAGNRLELAMFAMHHKLIQD